MYSADELILDDRLADRRTGSRVVNATILFLLRCFASDCGVAIGFSFSRCQAAQTVIRLREHADPLCRMYVRQTQEGGVIFKSAGVMY